MARSWNLSNASESSSSISLTSPKVISITCNWYYWRWLSLTFSYSSFTLSFSWSTWTTIFLSFSFSSFLMVNWSLNLCCCNCFYCCGMMYSWFSASFWCWSWCSNMSLTMLNYSSTIKWESTICCWWWGMINWWWGMINWWWGMINWCWWWGMMNWCWCMMPSSS